MLPDDSFFFVFILLGFQSQIDEKLLQFLVTVVYAQLFKTAKRIVYPKYAFNNTNTNLNIFRNFLQFSDFSMIYGKLKI